MQFLNNFAVYDWITIIYIIVGIACFIWTSIGNDYVFNKIEKSIQQDNSQKCAVTATVTMVNSLNNSIKG